MAPRERAWVIPTHLLADVPALNHTIEQCTADLAHEMHLDGLTLDRASVRRRLDLPMPDTGIPQPAADLLAALGVTITRPDIALDSAIPTAALLTTGGQGAPHTQNAPTEVVPGRGVRRAQHPQSDTTPER